MVKYKTEIEEILDYKNLLEITIKYYSDRKKYRYKLADEPKKTIQ